MLKFVEDLLQGAPVEWETLGEVMVRTKGIPSTASQMRLLNRSDGAVKVFAGGKTVAYLAYEDLPLQDVHFTPSIIVKSRGIVEFEYYDKAFSHKNELWSYHSKSETVDTKFVYYFLKTKETLLRTKAAIMGAMPQISIQDTENILIPIPPLPVQEKIVEILDKFTELEAKLGTELVLRQKQYEYYRNKLLTFGEEVEWKTLGEVSEISTGVSNRKDEVENGKYPLYVRSKNILRSDCYQFDETAIIIPGEGGIGEIFHYAVGKYALHQRAYRVHIHDEKLLDKFVFYYLVEHFKEYIVSISYNATVSSIRKPMLAEFLIPLPSLHVQEKIVSILDKFDTLANSLTEGLPREIALRHKQYEYYRDALLTFSKAT